MLAYVAQHAFEQLSPELADSCAVQTEAVFWWRATILESIRRGSRLRMYCMQ
jgi:hypothetical protein